MSLKDHFAFSSYDVYPVFPLLSFITSSQSLYLSFSLPRSSSVSVSLKNRRNMEGLSLATIAVFCVTTAVVIWAISFVNWVWVRPKKLERLLRQQGLHGNPYRLFVGDMKENTAMTKQAKSKPINLTDDIVPRVLPFVNHSIKSHGKNSFIWLGPVPRVIIMNPEQIKEIFTKINDFRRPNTNPLTKLLVRGLIAAEGEKWVKHRQIINPAFHQEKLKNMLPIFKRSCSDMIGKWGKLVSAEGRFELDVWPDLVSLTCDVISRTAFGSSYEEGRRIFQLQDEQANLAIQALQLVYIPGWRFLPTRINKRMKEVNHEIRASLQGIIDKRLKEMKANKVLNDDLLGILLESNFREIKEHGDNKKMGMSIKDVIDECKLFYFAGQETTSVLLVWTMVMLAKHSEWQHRAREEVLSVFGDGKPDLDGLSRLKVVTMILYEVLRLYPPVNVLARSLHKETKLGKLTLPAGVQVAIPILLVQQDEELWGDDAKEFKPERFADGISKATKSQVSFIPFAWGPRICIGQNFAMMEAKMAVAMILQRFWFELSPTYAHAPYLVITLHPQYGVQVILHKL